MTNQHPTDTLRTAYQQLKATQPKVRIRDAARRLGVSELQLLELGLNDSVVRLSGPCQDILARIEQLGYVMALTRNEYAVHERKGVYHNVSFAANGKMGLAVNPDIDLRLFMTAWAHAYAAEVQAGPNRRLRSIQFFNPQGVAMHKIYATPKTDLKAWDELVASFRATDQTSLTVPEREVPEPSDTLDPQAVDRQAFQEDWRALQDTHDFFGMLKKHGVQRKDAMRLAPEGYTRRLVRSALADMLHLAADRKLPIMVFVGNQGCIQIHTGPVRRILPMPGWINVMDPAFNLHVKLDGIAEIWETRKPTRDGVVTGLEVYDDQGDLIVYCFGKRKPGIPELPAWRDLMKELKAHVEEPA